MSKLDVFLWVSVTCYQLLYRKTCSILLIRSKENVFSNSKKIAKSPPVKGKYFDLQILKKYKKTGECYLVK